MLGRRPQTDLLAHTHVDNRATIVGKDNRAGPKIGGVREDLWNKRYAQINTFERHLVENGFPVIKFFLHISNEVERERLLERIERPELQWQFSEADLRHHHDWEAFQHTYEAMLSRTSTAWAPWYIIPANQRWYTYAAVASVLVHQFKALHTEYPPLDDEARQTLEHARQTLQQEQGK